MSREWARRVWESIYWPVLLPVLMLSILGVFFLAGIQESGGVVPIKDAHLRQLTGIAIGLVAAAVVLVIPFKKLVEHAYLLYAANVLLLVLVLAAGTSKKNTARWISIFGFDMQPSEFMKVTLVLTLARFIRFRSSYKTFKGLGTPFLLTLFPMALILKQPDLGTALLCVPILFTMLFVAGARLRHLATIALMGCAALLPVYKWGLKPYQRDRVDAFWFQLVGGTEGSPEASRLASALEKAKRGAGADTKPRVAQLERDLARQRAADRIEQRYYHHNSGYQLKRSTAAIGSGGWTGVGWGSGVVHRRVPERQTDFIFAVVAHEWGFLGGIFLLLLFGALLLAMLRVALRQRDPAGRLLCVGMFTLFAAQAFINLAMTVGLMPITGLTLPFVSLGRSSVLSCLIGVALICNVAARPGYEFGRGDFD